MAQAERRSGLLLLAGLIVPFILFAVTASRIGRWPSLDWRVPGELLVMVFLISLAPIAGTRWPTAPRWLAALLLLPIAIIHYADVEGPAVLGRDLDLAADLDHVPSLIGLFAGAASPWQIIGISIAAVLVPVGLAALIAWSLGAIERGLLGLPWPLRLAPLVLMGPALIGPNRFVSHETSISIARQGETVADAWRLTHGDRASFLARLGPPPATERDLTGLGRRDIYLIFFESYGAVLLDDPGLSARALPALARFQDKVTRAGLAIRSARIASPTYGGGSWLAHGTVDAGTWLANQRLYQLETTTDRPTWGRIMTKAGWQTFDIQPGLKTPLDHAAFWGFDRIVGADDLNYDGPSFGWFGIPDQYALDRSLTLPRDPSRPLFAQIVLVSSHIPFHPVPPVVTDPADVGRFATHPEVARLVATPPDWNDLAGPYMESVEYDLTVLADWLPRALGDTGVAIILGDHQPPALIGHASASHDVPIHILSKDAALVRRLGDAGFVDGAVPTGGAGTMANLMDRFLDAAAAIPAGAAVSKPE
ncbi:MAG: hypothetical protein JWO51_4656 [Rhodospirillales bacterium]|nr:hypothetical protein [Rhodospirillales bacterium]